MCGFAGSVSFSSVLEPGIAERGAAALHHRGPDGQASYRSPDGHAELAHARLSIIDLEGGTQPLSDARNETWAVVNGELYDFERIRNQLLGQGFTFKTKSDSEILLPLYERYGTHCVEHLRGEFAFAIFDQRAQRLVLGRDRFGIKPLFYAKLGDRLVFGSEIKALLAMGVPAKWDLESVWHGFHFAVPRTDRSFFEGVSQVPPGHVLIFDRSGVRVSRYWDFDYRPDTKLDEQGRRERFAELFREAVALRMRADVPVACYLSGGLDSCAVLGVASTLVPQPIHAFTLSFNREAYDERSQAERMAKKAGAKFTPIPVDETMLAEAFPGAVRAAETWFSNPHAMAKYLLSRAVRDAGYKVVLTGEGSDEVLAGYPHFRQDLALARSDRALLDKVEASNRVSRGLALSERSSELPAISDRIGHLPSWIGAILPATAALKGLATPMFMGLTERMRSPYSDFLDSTYYPRTGASRDAVHGSMYLWSKLMLPNYILTVLGDRMEMAHSIEGRVPFLDHVLIETVSRYPLEDKIHGTTEKWILREAVKPFLTDEIYQREKHPFLAPPASVDKSPLLEWITDTLSSSDTELPFFERSKVKGLVDALPSMDAERRAMLDPLILVLASAATMQREFGMST